MEFFQNDLTGMLKKMALPSMLMPITRKKKIKLTKKFFIAMDENFETPHGDEDKLLDYVNGEALVDLIPNAKLITLKGRGHIFPTIDTYNDKYFDDMINHF
jgi:hypothetical protein